MKTGRPAIKTYSYLGYYIRRYEWKYTVYGNLVDVCKKNNPLQTFRSLEKASDFIEDRKGRK